MTGSSTSNSLPVGEPAAGIGPDTRWTAIRHWWLAVEVSGKGSRLYDRDHKTPAYLALGVPEIWRVDLHERSVFVSRPESLEHRHADQVTWYAPGRDQPLVLSVQDLFRT